MDFWMWALTYLGIGAPTGLIVSRRSFAEDSKDPTRLSTVKEQEEYTYRGHTKVREVVKIRTELERLEACASTAVVWGWLGGIFWPLVVVGATLESAFHFCKNIAGGKELTEARRQAEIARTEAKAAELLGSIREDWKKEFGPDAPD